MPEYKGWSYRRMPWVPPIKGWWSYLLLIPFVAAIAVLAIFFFAAFLALFSIVALGFALRVWWLRRTLRRQGKAQTLEGEYIVISQRRESRSQDKD